MNSAKSPKPKKPKNALNVSPALFEKLSKIGIFSVENLLLHLPFRYEDETQLTPIAAAPIGEPVLIEGSVIESSVQFRPRRQLVAIVADESEQIVLRFVNFYGSLVTQFENARVKGKSGNQKVRAFGEIRHGFFGEEMVHPKLRFVSEDAPLAQELTPIYPTTEGVSQNMLRKVILAALKEANEAHFPEILDVNWYVKQGFMPFFKAVAFLHAPTPNTPEIELQERTHPAWRRIKFDEILAQQLSLRRAYEARKARGAPALIGNGQLMNALRATLPFTLTNAQERVTQEILIDLGNQYPMQRLLQGDVGSGKTIVAAIAACCAIEAGFQAALMAPTEILAQQHYLKLSSWLNPLGVTIVWLSGSLSAKAKREAQASAKTAQLIIGTHALIQEGVDFSRLGLAIIDEQHRFGVAQRLELKKKGGNPHQLMMSATPIPRTLAMSYYADLDVSTIDELPPGRQSIRTKLIDHNRRSEVISSVEKWVQKGSQAYWVCPLIEESETLDLQAAEDLFASLQAELPNLSIGLIHGRLKPAEKAEIMADFAANKIQILVATTVIEVGVDVPNAGLMVIEHAERFGLSQLHQLRGRVGRGQEEALCVLLYQSPLSQLAKARLKVIFEHTDGFEIARQDLHLRGPGEFIGARQAGAALLRYANLETDVDLIELARELAEKLLKNDVPRAEKHLARWLGLKEEFLRA